MSDRWVWCCVAVSMWLAATSGVLSGCGNEPPKPTGPCVSALDCPGSQLCVDGTCTNVTGEGGGTIDGVQEAGPEPAQEPGSDGVVADGQEPAADNQEPAADEAMADASTDQPPPDMSPKCVDDDGDGYCENIEGDRGAKDCNDKDKEIHPTAPERCNGEDDDCDGAVDEELTPPPFRSPVGRDPACSGRTSVTARPGILGAYRDVRHRLD